MSLFEQVAQATVRIECGSSRGSGFHFLRPDIIVTNHHVVAGAADGSVIAVGERGEAMQLTLRASSPTNAHDFAIFDVREPGPNPGHVLRPRAPSNPGRGVDIVFAGFPHGIPHLLVQRATVSGYVNDSVFYIDGSVNGGNSGGPIVDSSDGAVIGIVTQRRFLGAQDLERLAQEAGQLSGHCHQLAMGGGSVQIMGIDFGSFSGLMADAMLLIREALDANANAGIGIGFSINFVTACCEEMGIEASAS